MAVVLTVEIYHLEFIVCSWRADACRSHQLLDRFASVINHLYIIILLVLLVAYNQLSLAFVFFRVQFQCCTDYDPPL